MKKFLAIILTILMVLPFATMSVLAAQPDPAIFLTYTSDAAKPATGFFSFKVDYPSGLLPGEKVYEINGGLPKEYQGPVRLDISQVTTVKATDKKSNQSNTQVLNVNEVSGLSYDGTVYNAFDGSVAITVDGNFIRVDSSTATAPIPKVTAIVYGPTDEVYSKATFANMQSAEIITVSEEVSEFSIKIIGEDATSGLLHYKVFGPYTVTPKAVPKPFNLTWDGPSLTATAQMNYPADKIIYSIVNDKLEVIQTNETGVFTQVVAGSYNLTAEAYNTTFPHLKSEPVVKAIVIDNDPPVLNLIPVTVPGSTPGVVIEATDAGSGLDRIEATVNGKLMGTFKTGDIIYATQEGSNSITVTAFDKGGNKTSKTEVLTYDKNVLTPTITISKATNTTSSSSGSTSTPSGSSTIWHNTDIAYVVKAINTSGGLKRLITSVNGSMVNANSDNNSPETMEFKGELKDEGTYEIKAQAYDSKGAQSGKDAIATVKIDKTKPDKPRIKVTGTRIEFISEDEHSGLDYIKYAISGDYSSDSKDDSWHDRNNNDNDAEDGKFYEGDRLIRLKGQGEFTITATAYDVAGNISETSTRTVKIDTVAPNAPKFEGAGSGWITGDATTITVTVDGDNVETIKVKVNDGPSKDYASGETIEINPEGTTKLSAYAVGLNGISSPTTTQTVKFDNSAPDITVKAITGFYGNSSKVTLRVNFYDGESRIDKIVATVGGKEKTVKPTANDIKKGYIVFELPLAGISTVSTSASTNYSISTLSSTGGFSIVPLAVYGDASSSEASKEPETVQPADSGKVTTIPTQEYSTPAIVYPPIVVSVTAYDKAGNTSSADIVSSEYVKINPYTGR